MGCAGRRRPREAGELGTPSQVEILRGRGYRTMRILRAGLDGDKDSVPIVAFTWPFGLLALATVWSILVALRLSAMCTLAARMARTLILRKMQVLQPWLCLTPTISERRRRRRIQTELQSPATRYHGAPRRPFEQAMRPRSHDTVDPRIAIAESAAVAEV